MGHFSQNRRYRKGSLRVSLAQSHFPCAMGKRRPIQAASPCCVWGATGMRWWPVGTSGQAWRAAVPYPGEPLLRCGAQLTGCKTRKVRSEDHPWPQQHLQHLVKKCTFSRPAPDLPNPTLQGTPLQPPSVFTNSPTGRWCESHWLQGMDSTYDQVPWLLTLASAWRGRSCLSLFPFFFPLTYKNENKLPQHTDLNKGKDYYKIMM